MLSTIDWVITICLKKYLMMTYDSLRSTEALDLEKTFYYPHTSVYDLYVYAMIFWSMV